MQQSMVGGGGHKELDRTERLTELFHFFSAPTPPCPSLLPYALCYGNPLQYSCLENSMNRGAWQATVHGGAESQA